MPAFCRKMRARFAIKWRNNMRADKNTQPSGSAARRILKGFGKVFGTMVLVLFLIGVVLVLFGIGKSLLKTKFDKGIWFTGIGTVLAVLALLLVAGYNNTAYYPSTNDLQSSLTLANSCSSEFTLRVMFYVSFLVPFVLAYIFYAWRSIDIHKIDEKEMKDGGHSY